MRRILLLAGAAVVVLSFMGLWARGHAETPAYAAPSELLWSQMVTALDSVSMPGPANRQVMQILIQVQQQARSETKPAPDKKAAP